MNASDLLRTLADGRFHSGQELAGKLGVSRTAVWKAMSRIRDEFGVHLQAVQGKGYRIPGGLDLLGADCILNAMPAGSRTRVRELDVFLDVDSTNAYLLGRAARGAAGGAACAAERQRAGRGRRGRQWISPFGCNLYLSLLWRFPEVSRGLAAVSLAVAIAVCRALRDLGAHQAGVKWPNDIIAEGRKLAGILLEMGGEANGPCHVVVGVGVNVRMSEQFGGDVGQPWINVEDVVGGSIDRNRLAAALLHALVDALDEFQASGFSTFFAQWPRFDALRGRPVTVHGVGDPVSGTVRGVDERGALLVERNSVVSVFHSGEVTVRRAT